MNEFPVLARHSKILRLNFRKNKINKQTCMPVENKGKIERQWCVERSEPTKTKIHLQQNANFTI